MIRAATPDDVPAILALIRELAEYEKLLDQVRATADGLHRDLFGDQPKCGALVAEVGDSDASSPVGFALFCENYSTFWTHACLHLEDLFVIQDYRGRGLGRDLLAAVAAEARRRECPRMDWNVLGWNRPAIDFYEELGAELLPDWRTCRLEGEALTRVAGLAAKIP